MPPLALAKGVTVVPLPPRLLPDDTFCNSDCEIDNSFPAFKKASNLVIICSNVGRC